MAGGASGPVGHVARGVTPRRYRRPRRGRAPKLDALEESQLATRRGRVWRRSTSRGDGRCSPAEGRNGKVPGRRPCKKNSKRTVNRTGPPRMDDMVHRGVDIDAAIPLSRSRRSRGSDANRPYPHCGVPDCEHFVQRSGGPHLAPQTGGAGDTAHDTAGRRPARAVEPE